MEDYEKLALETIELNKQAIIFLPSRASAEKTAEDIARLLPAACPDIEKEILHRASMPTRQCRKLSHCVNKAVAFHHSGLLNSQKELIEESFKDGKIKIICCTPTLAAGLSLPVFRVIIKSLKRYNEKWGMDWIPVLEYLQMAGRAGRPEYEPWGEAITLVKDEPEKEEIVERYIHGLPEDIYSKLAAEPILRTHVLSLIASGIIRNKTELLDFFKKTFWAKQFNDLNKLEQIVNKVLTFLEKWEFITLEKKETSLFSSAKELSSGPQQRLTATKIGKRISELYLDPLTAKHLLDCLENYGHEKNLFSLLQMICHTFEIRPLLTIKKREQETILEEFNKRYSLLLEPEPSAFDPEYDEFLNSIKTALFFEEWIQERDEDYLLEKYDIRPGEIRAKLEIADWLLYASEELSTIMEKSEIVKELRKLRIRVEYGVREELLTLLKLRGIGRIRARRLYHHGIKDLGNIKKIDLTSLSQILGKAIAEDVKKQVGEELPTEIPKGTRKGQLSMEKFDRLD